MLATAKATFGIFTLIYAVNIFIDMPNSDNTIKHVYLGQE